MECKLCKDSGAVQDRPCPECARCEYCGSSFQVSEQKICKDCERWKALGMISSPKIPPSKPSPMAANSYGLHEKYFQDG